MLKKRKNRIILDTNLWISFLISKRLKKLDTLLYEDNLTLVFSQESLEEFIEVAKRPKFKKYLLATDLEKVIHLFNVYGELVEVVSTIELCRDTKDNFLLSLAIDSKADFLITGDKDLLTIKKFQMTEILTYTEFETRPRPK
ncbi:MAG: putative toxin-antitoxin system toxin component, PIN family [Leptospiraceae bacterium]|nr:putative toxin-antitoxin system toxin component, PIN family [Leptospiraceae bacterium]